MYNSIYSPGALVEVLFNGYKHYAIVSDRLHEGWPMLISLSARTGTVLEEPWHVCTQGKHVRLASEQGALLPEEVLLRARSLITRIKWRLLDRNCEHFARWAHALSVESKQVKRAAVALGFIAVSYLALSRRA